MPTTPNRGYTYPGVNDAATVPEDLQAPLHQIDSDVQGVVDGLNAKVGLEADGTAPLALLTEIRSEVASGTAGLASQAELDERVPIFPTLVEAQAWEAAHPGRKALTIEAPPDPNAWVPEEPSFNTMAGTVTIPSDQGATYTINGVQKSAGTHSVTVPSTVTVEAVAKPGYALAGQTQWVQVFEENVTAYENVALSLSPQLYYRMDDTSGVPVNRGTGGATGQMVGTPTYGAAGIGGYVRSLTFPSGARFQLNGLPGAGTPAYTYAAIVKTPASGNASPFEDWNQRNSIKIAANVWHGYGPTTIRPNLSGHVGGTLYHVALTWDGTTSRFYIDGVQVQAVADPGPVTSAAALKIGEYTTGALTVAGVIVDHTKAFTATQIADLSDAVVR